MSRTLDRIETDDVEKSRIFVFVWGPKLGWEPVRDSNLSRTLERKKSVSGRWATFVPKLSKLQIVQTRKNTMFWTRFSLQT